MSFRVLYIQRRRSLAQRSLSGRLRAHVAGVDLVGQDGFFEASLCAGGMQCTFVHLEDVLSKESGYFQNYKWVLVNRKAVASGKFKQIVVGDLLKKVGSVPCALVINNAEEDKLPEQKVLDRFDLIFKRECLRDKSVYQLRPANEKKLRATMISCPFVTARKTAFGLRIKPMRFVPPRAGQPCIDVSFVGADTNERRAQLVESISRSALSFSGGLYSHSHKALPLEWAGPKASQLSTAEYVRLVHSTKVNLALAGHGGFTYRHLELWYLAGFVLSEMNLEKIDFPWFASPREGEQYVSFDTVNDMITKALYYAVHDDARRLIAEAGQAYFHKLYDSEAHGRYIREALESACL